jgi:hypothetical protein
MIALLGPGEGVGLRVRPDGLRYASIKAVLAVAGERGLVPPEVMLAATGQARRGLWRRSAPGRARYATSPRGFLGYREPGGACRW